MHAVRNIRLCTKDCLCLYVCPTGATDTEDGQIDAKKCLDGCRACVDSCPSHAISLAPDEYPAPQEKIQASVKTMINMMDRKSRQEIIAASIKKSTEDPIERQLAEAIEMSNRLMAEDLIRECGFLLPQGNETKKLLSRILENNTEDDCPVEAIKRLLELL